MMRRMIGGLLAISAAMSHADEGMWLFNRPPVQEVEEKYGFKIETEWMDHLRESSVRLSSGGSGSFVSAEGLVLTNHHVGARIIASLSTPERDLIQNGFHARKFGDELPCGGLQLNVLVSIKDVTAEVQASITDGMGAEAAVMARRAVIAKLESVPDEESERVLRDVVTLYQGGAYHLYEYRRYTDVRLVFAPDNQVASYGGDADNFEYPRYCLDFCFFRAYEDGEPVKVDHFLKWSEEGAQENELAFVSGHPGSTDRGLTHAQVKAMRDVWMPYSLEMAKRREVLLEAWGSRDLENRRRSKRRLVGTRNWRKAKDGRLAGLLDPGFMEGHRASEMSFRKRLDASSEGKDAEAAFVEIEELLERQKQEGFRGALFGGGDAFDGELFQIARTLVKAAREGEKPDEERQSGFREADRVSLELRLFADDPIYRDLDELRLADSLSFLCGKLGSADPAVAAVLSGKSPKARAAELVRGTGLNDVKLRKRLYEGGKKAIEASDDPMIALVRSIDGEIEMLEERYQRDEEILKQCHERISRARFALDGETGYPDATFSLRLSFGKVSGISEGNIPFHTNYGGLYERERKQASTPPFDLPTRWKDAGKKVDESVALNFVSVHDITGGNSGSPVVNTDGELIGLIFDTNLDGLTNDVAYDGTSGRAVSVDSAGMMHALEVVYEAEELVSELRK
ncbi:S46 family peptidase [Haloferula sp.]|uniref:S46 family peptidase n=1 Tax=Haloferula sp. TaxID=2497595 RepID=UPI00329BF549